MNASMVVLDENVGGPYEHALRLSKSKVNAARFRGGASRAGRGLACQLNYIKGAREPEKADL